MASYHLAVKTVSRSTGRSATAAAAYRAGAEIADERTGLVHDYTRKQGVEYSALVLPADAPKWAEDRASLWNAAEQAETRKNSTVAREFEIALPAELSADERKDLAMSFASEISERHHVAVDVAIHAPGREGDHRNHHAHLLVTTRQLGPEGMGAKTRELDQKQSGEVERWRERWAEMQNHALERAGVEQRVDHRSLQRQGIEAEPQVKMGPAITAIERRASQQAERDGRTYEPVTDVGKHNAEVQEKQGLRGFIERSSAWLKEHGAAVGERVSAFRDRISNALGRGSEPDKGGSQQAPPNDAAKRIQARLGEVEKALGDREKRDLDRTRERSRDRDGPER